MKLYLALTIFILVCKSFSMADNKNQALNECKESIILKNLIGDQRHCNDDAKSNKLSEEAWYEIDDNYEAPSSEESEEETNDYDQNLSAKTDDYNQSSDQEVEAYDGNLIGIYDDEQDEESQEEYEDDSNDENYRI